MTPDELQQVVELAELITNGDLAWARSRTWSRSERLFARAVLDLKERLEKAETQITATPQETT